MRGKWNRCRRIADGSEDVMSVRLWAYEPDICDGDFCPNDCDRCSKAKWIDFEEFDDGEEETDDTDK